MTFPGYRSIPLKNIYNEQQELASLLVHIEVEWGRGEEYQSLEELRDQMRRRMAERDAIITQKVRAQQKGQAMLPVSGSWYGVV